MSDQPIIHKSEPKKLRIKSKVLEITNKNGIKCFWSGNEVYHNSRAPGNHHQNPYYYEFTFSWIFDWSELRETGIDSLSGQIIITFSNDIYRPRTIGLNLTQNHQVIEACIKNNSPDEVMFEYQLTPHRLSNQEEEASYDEMFLPSELNDTILVIDEKRLHVNRAFLSIHSEFFRALFSSKFKEGQMDEIPVKDVSYEDFGLLMSTIYPDTMYPNDKTAEKLLELADRFIIPSVIRNVEFHLLHDTQINSEKLIWMADKYGMAKLLEKCMGELNTVEKVKKFHTSPEYKKLSKEATAEILDRLVKMV